MHEHFANMVIHDDHYTWPDFLKIVTHGVAWRAALSKSHLLRMLAAMTIFATGPVTPVGGVDVINITRPPPTPVHPVQMFSA